MKQLRRYIVLILAVWMLVTMTYAAPASSFPMFSDSSEMHYLKLTQIASILSANQLDSGYNDAPILRAYQYLTGSKENLSKNSLRKAVISYFDSSDVTFEQFAKVMCGQYDDYSAFLSQAEYNAAFPESGDYKGIGITVRPFGGTIAIAEVHEGSPADLAGLSVNDRIIGINGHDLRLQNYEKNTAIMMEATKKASVYTVRKFESNELIEVELISASIDVPNVEYKLMQDGIGYLRINLFSGESAYISELSHAQAYLQENHVSKLIIDLRNNPGGDLLLLLQTINAFIPDQGVRLFDVISRNDKIYYESVGDGVSYDNIAILIDDASASSAEICAGALSDTGYATLIGTKTYGKGRGQTDLHLIDGNLLHFSLSEAILPIRGKYHGIGIQPDIYCENEVIRVLSEEDLTGFEAANSSNDADNILKLQKMLYALGYLGTYNEGEFDESTQNALRSCLVDLDKDPSDSCDAETLRCIAAVCQNYLDAYFTKDSQLAEAMRFLTEV